MDTWEVQTIARRWSERFSPLKARAKIPSPTTCGRVSRMLVCPICPRKVAVQAMRTMFSSTCRSDWNHRWLRGDDARAQQPPSPQQETFRSAVDLVTIQASVKDARGRVVSGLTTTDFEVRDNGQLRPILSLRSNWQSPLSLAILVDMSGSMRAGPKIAMARQAYDRSRPSSTRGRTKWRCSRLIRRSTTVATRHRRGFRRRCRCRRKGWCRRGSRRRSRTVHRRCPTGSGRIAVARRRACPPARPAERR